VAAPSTLEKLWPLFGCAKNKVVFKDEKLQISEPKQI